MRGFGLVSGGAAVVLGLVLPAGDAAAAVAWTGDFETTDTSQYNFLLNEEWISIVDNTAVQGTYAALIQLDNTATWPNGLKRVELQHRPEDARTAEGFTDFVAWSFYLPETLTVDPNNSIGYWESNNSFQQQMVFNVRGEQIEFITRRPSNVVQWADDSGAAPETWHRIAMRILWSTDPKVGEVDVWFDGELVVDQAPAQTLADNNPHFLQFGLLRGAIEFDDLPMIMIDHALEGDSLEDVEYDALSQGGEDTGSTGDPDGDTSGGAAETTGGPDPGGSTTTGPPGTTSSASTTMPASTMTPTSATDGDTDAPAGNEDDAGCGCGVTGRAGGLAWLLLLGLGRRQVRCR